ncbi:hypothetical protein PAXRUDRAFT_172308 [Paxillus rubicundulus Ve08.2h10]|uniref:Uncharacterized protein n=1 Tax=Paxillus rubicundulus Ve08.2h10 TaxID=930991 RepID=A0A0D0CWX4_9AGAM|nr:hypothetical protein PAXRUDRAFT_172308 [Paxillus rubicundulus Ve08.2h10]
MPPRKRLSKQRTAYQSAALSRYATRSRCLIDAYQKGLDGKQAAWAANKYHGHRVLPESILQELDNTQAK